MKGARRSKKKDRADREEQWRDTMLDTVADVISVIERSGPVSPRLDSAAANSEVELEDLEKSFINAKLDDGLTCLRLAVRAITMATERNVSPPEWATKEVQLRQFLGQKFVHYRDGDPLAPFVAMSVAFLRRIPPPYWAVEHFGNAAMELNQALGGRGADDEEIPKQVGLALGFDIKTRKDNPGTLGRYREEARVIFVEYLAHRAAGKKTYPAIEAVADSRDHNNRPISRNTIERRLNLLARSLHLQNLQSLDDLADSVPLSKRNSPEQWAYNTLVVANLNAIRGLT
jgi:hypothetical protein